MFRFPPRRILVPIDLTRPSFSAFRAAADIARRFNARVEVVYCAEPVPPELAVYGAAPVEKARTRRIEVILRRRCASADCFHVVRGDPAQTTLRLARDRKADLIVMGTHGRRGAARALLGSVAETVLRRSPVPVLVLRKDMRPLKRVLAPIQGDAQAATGLVAAGVVARALKARLDVLHVVTDPLFGPNPLRLLGERLAELPKDVRRDTKATMEVRRGSPVLEILRAARGRDLLVLVSRPKSLLGDMILGTTVERLARHCRIPVLAIPAKRSPGTVLIGI